MKLGKSKIFFLLIIVPFLAGCISFSGTNNKPQNDGGVYVSVDGGENWIQRVAIPEIGGRIVGIPNANIITLTFDPNDHQAIYIGTEQDGLFYTYDGGIRWHQVAPTFASGKVPSVAVDYFNKCVIFATIANKIYKTEDCSRNWKQVYFDTIEDTTVNVVKTEWYNKNIVYAGNSRGEILKSLDDGNTWTTVGRFGGSIVQIVIDKDDTRVLYAVTDAAGIFKTIDAGNNWLDINADLQRFDGAAEYRDIAQDMQKPDTFIMATRFGLIKTDDGGESWESIKLITPESTANILSVAIDPSDGNIIYYGTDTTLYKTTDGGQTWKPKKLLTSRWCNVLAIDPIVPKTIYMGIRWVEEE